MSILNSAAVGLRLRPGVWLAGGLVLAFLLLFLVLPVARVFFTAFVEADGSLTIGHFEAFFAQGLMREAFFNSLYVAVMSAVFASLIAVPLAYFTVRFQFRGAIVRGVKLRAPVPEGLVTIGHRLEANRGHVVNQRVG